MIEKRLIGKYEGSQKGPLFICMAGMHGNEPAGVLALETVFQLLDREPSINPGFVFMGRMLGLVGNLRAFRQGKRFIVKDLNRQWSDENIGRISQANEQDLDSEDLEIRELLEAIRAEIDDYQPDRIVLLDLHTTSAAGGIFAIATDEPESVRIATGLHAPVVTGLLRGIQGTTLHFFNRKNFRCRTAGAAFEAGQHQDPLSVNRAIAAVINCMRSIGCVRPEDVENRHDELLIKYSKDLPKIADIIKVHHILADDHFKMRPGYQNFQPVIKGEWLASDRHGEILSPSDGMILMPLYQPQGSDGFFLVKPVG